MELVKADWTTNNVRYVQDLGHGVSGQSRGTEEVRRSGTGADDTDVKPSAGGAVDQGW